MSGWEYILAAMLMLATPGRSIYSQVRVDEHAAAPCDEPNSLLCQPPRFSAAHGSFVVVEGYQQGLERYAQIARVTDRVLRRGWKTPQKYLWRYAVTVMFHESGFRRDVHEGIGSAARGDCRWAYPDGRRAAPRAKGSRRIEGSCRSHCLAQILLEGRMRSSQGYGPKDLVGLDDAATERCVEVAVHHLDRCYRYCATRGPRPLTSCVIAMYGGMTHARGRRINERLRTMNRLMSAPTELSEKVRTELGLDEELP